MSFARLPEWCLRLGIAYLVLGMMLGAYMGMKEDFTFKDVHAHINLMGYAMTFLMGLFLKAYPSALKLKLTKIAAVLLLGFVPITLVLLMVYYLGHDKVEPVLGMSSMIVLLGNILFAISVFRATATK